MRYRVMTVPGRREDGTDTAWYVLDFYTRRSTLVGTGDAARPIALRRATERTPPRHRAQQRRTPRSAAALAGCGPPEPPSSEGRVITEQMELVLRAPVRPPLVVSYGVGLDSTAMLVEMHNRGIRPDLILFSDTGGEKPETYAYIAIINTWLVSVGFPTVTVVRYEPARAPYTTLEGKCLANETLPSLAFGGHSCALVFKRDVMVKYLKAWTPAQAAIARGEKIVKAIGYDASKADLRRRAKADRATERLRLQVAERTSCGQDPLADQWEIANCTFAYYLQDYPPERVRRRGDQVGPDAYQVGPDALAAALAAHEYDVLASLHVEVDTRVWWTDTRERAPGRRALYMPAMPREDLIMLVRNLEERSNAGGKAINKAPIGVWVRRMWDVIERRERGELMGVSP